MKRRKSYEAERTRHRKAGKPPDTFTLTTRVASKWRLVDLETGEVYEPDPEKSHGFHWRLARLKQNACPLGSQCDFRKASKEK